MGQVLGRGREGSDGVHTRSWGGGERGVMVCTPGPGEGGERGVMGQVLGRGRERGVMLDTGVRQQG